MVAESIPVISSHSLEPVVSYFFYIKLLINTILTAGVELMKCDGEDSALRLLEDPGAGGDTVDTGGDGGGSDGDGGQSCSLTPTLVHIPASALHHPGLVEVLVSFTSFFAIGNFLQYNDCVYFMYWCQCGK